MDINIFTQVGFVVLVGLACKNAILIVEFAKIQRDVIDRGVFTSVHDLARKLRRYIRAYEKSARPFRWTYTDPQRRIKANVLTGTAH